LERSGKMIIGCLLVLEKVGKSEKMFNLLLYHRADQQGCVTIKNRPEVYEKCATMLFERWDRSRNIRFSLPFEAHIRPAMMYIAHWIYSNIELRAGVTERLLIAKASEYLLKRRFEDPDEAETAANEFIGFCRGRAWIFTDTGTEKSGERLYQFTHQTFLEYFTAGYLVRTHPTPETIMSILIPRIAKREWDVVAQLAFQIQNRGSEDAGDKLLLMLIEYADKAEDAEKLNVLAFAARCLNFMVPTPKVTREITSVCLKFMFYVGKLTINNNNQYYDRIDSDILGSLLNAASENCKMIAQDLEKILTEAIKSEDEFLGWIALDICLSNNERYIKNNYPWDQVFTRIVLNCKEKAETLYPKSLFLFYRAVWDKFTNINNMISCYGLGSLFDISGARSLSRNMVYGISMGEILLSNVPYVQKNSVKWNQEYQHLLEELGKGISFDSPPKIKRLCTINIETIKSLMELSRPRKNVKIDHLGHNTIFALFILFAILVELCDLFSLDFGLKSIEERRHPFFIFNCWIFLARFKQVQLENVQEEMIKCNFSSEQQSYIWQWIRREANLLQYQAFQVTSGENKASQQVISRKKRKKD